MSESGVNEKRYIISEAAQKTGVESHVLRYWEDELGLEIPRNEMGHRYYTEGLIQLFKQIKELKDSGFQLKAVRTVLGDKNSASDTSVVENSAATLTVESSEEEIKRSEDKLAQFEQIIGSIVDKSLAANNIKLGNDISNQVTDQVSNKVIKEMDYLLRIREEAEDERYKKLDETIRGLQRSNKEAAAYKERRDKSEKKKKKFFAGKNK